MHKPILLLGGTASLVSALAAIALIPSKVHSSGIDLDELSTYGVLCSQQYRQGAAVLMMSGNIKPGPGSHYRYIEATMVNPLMMAASMNPNLSEQGRQKVRTWAANVKNYVMSNCP